MSKNKNKKEKKGETAVEVSTPFNQIGNIGIVAENFRSTEATSAQSIAAPAPTVAEVPAQSIAPAAETAVTVVVPEVTTATPTPTPTAMPTAHCLPKRLIRDVKAKEISETPAFRREFPNSHAFVRALQELVKAGKIKVAVADNGDCDCDAVLLERLMGEVRAYHAAHRKKYASPAAKPVKVKKSAEKKPNPRNDFAEMRFILGRAKEEIESVAKSGVDLSAAKEAIAAAEEKYLGATLGYGKVTVDEIRAVVVEAAKAAKTVALNVMAEHAREAIRGSKKSPELFSRAMRTVDSLVEEGLANLFDARIYGRVGFQLREIRRNWDLTGRRVGTSNRPMDEFRDRNRRDGRREDRGTHGGPHHAGRR